jgi:hypothetical protein
MNHLQASAKGYVRTCSKSANSLTKLKSSPFDSSSTLGLVPNGTIGIEYRSRVKTDKFVWYLVNYRGTEGYIRGDHLCY